MKIETFTVSVACHVLVKREELAAALRKAAGDQGIYYVEVEDRKDFIIDRKDFIILDDPHTTPTPGARKRGRPPKIAKDWHVLADATPFEPPPKRKCSRSVKTEEERGVPVTHRKRADGSTVETRGRCPGGATP